MPSELLRDYRTVTAWMCPVLIRRFPRQEEQETVVYLAGVTAMRLARLQAEDNHHFRFLRGLGVIRQTEGHRRRGSHRRYPLEEVPA